MITKSKDINGNSIAKFTKKGERGFSVQTCGNMPVAHRHSKESWKAEFMQRNIMVELQDYISQFGTERQKRLLGVKSS
jgi:hypothetical protein